jgi:segregation and condensation protein A
LDKSCGDPFLTLAGYQGTLEALLTLARARRIAWEKISVLELVDQLAAALRDAPAATQMTQKGDWLVMAAWLLQLRARLLWPAEAPEHRAAQDAADQVRERLSAWAGIQAVAAWLEARPQLGRDVFVRGRPENLDPMAEGAADIDVIEFLWASMALFDAGGALGDVSEAYRPPWRDLYSIAEAGTRILQRLSETPDGLALERLLPDEAVTNQTSALRQRNAWTSTLIASLELAKQGAVRLAQADPFTPVRVRQVPAEPPA